jgi:hypothetical protein
MRAACTPAKSCRADAAHVKREVRKIQFVTNLANFAIAGVNGNEIWG